MKRIRLVCDSLAVSGPAPAAPAAAPVTASELMRTSRASPRAASSNPPWSAADSTTPRAPAAAISIEVSVFQVCCVSAASSSSVSSPVPWPRMPQSMRRSFARKRR